MTDNDRRGCPLAGIGVLDLADEKGSFCSKLLADWGARVIKIEKPGGDPSRSIGPFWGDSPNPEKSLFFLYNNTNKLGVTLNLENHDGKQIFLELIRRNDIVVETFPPGYLDELGIGLKSMHEINPALILVSVTDFGQDGPRRRYRSCDIVASAFGGQMYVSGSPETPPLKPFGEQSFYTASLFAAIGALLALRKRKKDGKGEHVDVSLQESVTATLDHVMVRYFYDGLIPKREGNVLPGGGFGILPCKDGFILMTLFQQWETVVEWLGKEGMVEDLDHEKWKNEEYRIRHIDHVVEVLSRWTKFHTTRELFEMGQMMRFPWAPVLSEKDALESPQLKSRQFFVEIDHPDMNASLKYPGMPYKCRPQCRKKWKRAPLIGEDNSRILHEELGFPLTNLKDLLVKPLSEKGTLDSGILSGIRVLDFTRVLAGPYATRVLADFGAQVIKVQSKKTAKGAESNQSGYFRTWNRNKRSITLDMTYPEARALALRLVAVSDVVIENFSPRVMSNWEMDYEKLKVVRPDLTMVSMSGAGHDGPWKDIVAFGPTVQALSGLTFLTSFNATSPIGLGYSFADIISGLYGTISVLTALEYRDKTGNGQYVDLSEYEAACTLLGPALLNVVANRKVLFPQGNRSDHIPAAPYGCYRCLGKDRWCVIAVFSEVEWLALCKIFGNPNWSKEKRFSTLKLRKLHIDELNKLLEQRTSERKAADLVRELQEAGVPSGIVQNAQDLANDPHLKDREFFVRLEHSTYGKTISDKSPIKLCQGKASNWKAAPLLGEDNRYVFIEVLGMQEEELSAYVEKGVIA